MSEPPAPPPADLEVTARLAVGLVGTLVPEPGIDLARLELDPSPESVGEGWDNVLWPIGRYDGQPLVLRIPRRHSARRLLRHETLVLRRLATEVADAPMSIPLPLATGEDALLMPWFDGTVAARAAPAARAAVARDLAVMLARVHGLPDAGEDGPSIPNPVRGVPPAARAAAFAADLERVDLRGADHDRARRLWDRGMAAAAWRGPSLLLHGDPHPGNVVLLSGAEHSATGEEAAFAGSSPAAAARAALIDWGDTTVGDPASDLGSLLLHDPTGAVLDTYREHARWSGSDDDEVFEPLVERAWAWAARLAITLLTAYPRQHPLGRGGARLLAADRG